MLSIATLAGIDAEPQAPFAFPLSPSGFPLLYNVPSFNYQNSLPIQHQPAAYDDAFMIKKRVSTTAGCRNNDGALVPCAHSTHETPALRKSPTPRVAAQPYGNSLIPLLFSFFSFNFALLLNELLLPQLNAMSWRTW